MNNGNDLKIKLPVGYEKLEEYVKQTGKESMEIYKYAMFNCPELIADIDSLKDVLTKMSYNEQADFSVDKVCTGYYETLDVCDL